MLTNLHGICIRLSKFINKYRFQGIEEDGVKNLDSQWWSIEPRILQNHHTPFVRLITPMSYIVRGIMEGSKEGSLRKKARDVKYSFLNRHSRWVTFTWILLHPSVQNYRRKHDFSVRNTFEFRSINKIILVVSRYLNREYLITEARPWISCVAAHFSSVSLFHQFLRSSA